MNKLKIDNYNYEDQIIDLYPIEIKKELNEKTLWIKTLNENYKVNKTLGSINYNRLKEIKQKEIKRRSKDV